MPTFKTAGLTTLGSAPPCVRGRADVLALLPAAQRTEEHPVLDALAEGLASMHVAYQQVADYAAAQADVLRATGKYLDGLGRDRGIVRAQGERDGSYRERILAWHDVSTIDALRETINAILAPYTTAKAQLYESILDRWYVSNGTDGGAGDCLFHSFVSDGNTNTGPSYPDRLYPDDAPRNFGLFRPQSDPGGAVVFADPGGRCFIVRCPELNDTHTPRAFAQAGDASWAAQTAMFVGNSHGSGFAFVSNNFLLSDEVYGAIASSVEAIKGQAVRWMLVVDPKLR